MSLLAFSLVLAAAFCHATWNFFLKRLNAGPELVWLFSVVTVVIYLPLAVWAAWGQTPTLAQAGAILLSTILHLAYFLLLQLGYRKGDLSLVYPTARATGPILSVGFAVAVLGEPLTMQMAAGGLLIIAGIVMLTGGGRGRTADGQGAAVSLGFGLAVGMLIGSYTVWDARSVSLLMVPPLLLDYASSVTRCVIMTPLALRRRPQIARLWRDHRPAVLIIAALNPLAYILVLYALRLAPVTHVAPVREVSVLLTVLAGSLLLGEGHLRRRLTWGGVILAGVATLALA